MGTMACLGAGCTQPIPVYSSHSNLPNPISPGSSGGGGSTAVDFRFNEPNTSLRELDILFVIHATGSFNGQLSQGIASGLSSFVTALNGIDYQIGVMLAYPSGPSSGVLFNSNANIAAGVGPVLASSVLSI